MRCHWLLALSTIAIPTLARADGDVSAVVGPDGIEFKSGSAVVAKYATSPKLSKPFLYPVLAPDGVPVTRAWPIEKGLPGEATTDHVHQKSVWFCHGDVIPEGIDLKIKTTDRAGKGVDFWSEAKDKDGTPRHGLDYLREDWRTEDGGQEPRDGRDAERVEDPRRREDAGRDSA